jgi:phage/plasmid-associated DNA primase
LKFTKEYKDSGDYVLQFMKECTSKSEKKSIHISILFESYKRWLKRNYPKEDSGNNRSFSKSLRTLYPDNQFKNIGINGNPGLAIENISFNYDPDSNSD